MIITSYKIYPNPVNHILSIELNNSNLSEAEAQLYNSIGEKLLSQNCAKEKTIDLSQFKEGIYVLRIVSATGSQSFKIVKANN